MGFKSKGTNWSEVSAAGASKMIPAGGYVAVITKVEDVESKEYLRCLFDIAEGEHKGFFATDDRPYTHQFVRSYKDTAMGFMKQFLDCIEDSNANFKQDGWDNNEQDLVGKYVGVIIQREDYTNNNGEDRARMNVVGFTNSENIRFGRYVLPEPEDNRDGASTGSTAQTDQPTPNPTGDSGTVYDADLPF